MRKLYPLLSVLLLMTSCTVPKSESMLEYERLEKERQEQSDIDKISYLKKQSYVDSIRVTNSIPLILTRVTLIGPSSVGGYEPTISYEVFSDKEIKYLKFKVEFYNRVLDRVYGTIRMRKEFNLFITGPLKKGDKFSEVQWDPVYNSDIDCMLIKSITIEYMDGSVDNFENREVLKLLVPYELMYYYEISYGVRSSIPNWYGKFNVERCCNFKSIFTQL
tara:strand:+ start:220 stop:876 length:657 start_codon:yes stop_codon:yes gene_type:complete